MPLRKKSCGQALIEDLKKNLNYTNICRIELDPWQENNNKKSPPCSSTSGSEKRGKIWKSEQSDFDEVHYSQLFVSPKVTFCIETTKSGLDRKKTSSSLLLFKRFCLVSHDTIIRAATTGFVFNYTNCYILTFCRTVLCNYLQI